MDGVRAEVIDSRTDYGLSPATRAPGRDAAAQRPSAGQAGMGGRKSEVMKGPVHSSGVMALLRTVPGACAESALLVDRVRAELRRIGWRACADVRSPGVQVIVTADINADFPAAAGYHVLPDVVLITGEAPVSGAALARILCADVIPFRDLHAFAPGAGEPARGIRARFARTVLPAAVAGHDVAAWLHAAAVATPPPATLKGLKKLVRAGSRTEFWRARRQSAPPALDVREALRMVASAAWIDARLDGAAPEQALRLANLSRSTLHRASAELFGVSPQVLLRDHRPLRDRLDLLAAAAFAAVAGPSPAVLRTRRSSDVG
jgi:hypothetical protein